MQLNTRVTEVHPEPMSQLESAHNEVKLTIGQCFQQVAALKARLEPVVVGRHVDAAAKSANNAPAANRCAAIEAINSRNRELIALSDELGDLLASLDI